PAAVAEASGVRARGGGRGGDDDDVQKEQFEDATYPYDERMKGKEYEELLTPLQIELVKAQRWVKDTKQRVLIILEGRDAAGKGGTIKTVTEHLNPRGARVVALLKPNETERGQWYFQRY